ncbi:hypothetical protein AVEN_103733-1 [Araneus ventricosus]|uniref:Uncharacterized protein n=1 Tax=Araneus ventricosus TaxID=182803 RepID=A0A4Y2RKQ6_ARAVE|nr:hypothetical protein AVEN_103733-1 [Araneus ventricosus]
MTCTKRGYSLMETLSGRNVSLVWEQAVVWAGGGRSSLIWLDGQPIRVHHKCKIINFLNNIFFSMCSHPLFSVITPQGAFHRRRIAALRHKASLSIADHFIWVGKIVDESSSARKLGALKISSSISSSKGGKIKAAANQGSLRTSPFQDRSTAGNNWSRETVFH